MPLPPCMVPSPVSSQSIETPNTVRTECRNSAPGLFKPRAASLMKPADTPSLRANSAWLRPVCAITLVSRAAKPSRPALEFWEDA